jgi:magnesium chelatase subunit D
MKPPAYPFSAIVGQEPMKLALLLSAIDWRISVLLRGDKGAGKTTTARALASLLPSPAPFVNLPIGTTEDRLLGGLHLERTLKGDPVLKPGLVVEAHGGVLYVDEVNLLAPHLGDSMLDTASSGIHIVEREGLSATHPAEFVLLGTMNPEEGTLRPQLSDRFALAVDIAAPQDAAERKLVVQRRLAFERDASAFWESWAESEGRLCKQITHARASLRAIECSDAALARISESICGHGVRSLRADLAAVRASLAYAALLDDASVQPHHVDAVLPLVLAHRVKEKSNSRSSPPPPPPSAPQHESSDQERGTATNAAQERIFTARKAEAVEIPPVDRIANKKGMSSSVAGQTPGAVVGSLRTETPVELDVRATLLHAMAERGVLQPRLSDLHERIREPRVGTRYLFLIDSSGSHGAQERMRLVKGAACGLIAKNVKHGDEVAILTFRGSAAQVTLEATGQVQDALDALQYLPTGGRTPLAHGLRLARSYVTPATVLILLTDGKANVALHAGDAWEEALEEARQIKARSMVIDTEAGAERLGRAKALASALAAEYVPLAAFDAG